MSRRKRRPNNDHAPLFSPNQPTAIHPNLKQRLVDAGQWDRTQYSSHWVRIVTSVDHTEKSGYAFHGQFIDDGDIELSLDDHLFIIASAPAPPAHYEHYEVIWLKHNGEIEHTGLIALNGKRRWSIQLRDQIELLLKRKQHIAVPFSQVIAMLATRKAEYTSGHPPIWTRQDLGLVLYLIRQYAAIISQEIDV